MPGAPGGLMATPRCLNYSICHTTGCAELHRPGRLGSLKCHRDAAVEVAAAVETSA